MVLLLLKKARCQSDEYSSLGLTTTYSKSSLPSLPAIRALATSAFAFAFSLWLFNQKKW
jgi:hypothetical protein